MWAIKLCAAAFSAGVLVACAWGMTQADPHVVTGAFSVLDTLKVCSRDPSGMLRQ